MLTRLLVVVVSFTAVTLGADFAGTWKLNIAKSTLKGSNSNIASETMKIEQTTANTYHIVYEMVTKTGDKQNPELTVTFDGKEHPREGKTGATEIAEHPNSTTWKTTRYRDGKVIGGITAVVAADNRTHTATTKNVGQDGITVEEIYFFERQ